MIIFVQVLVQLTAWEHVTCLTPCVLAFQAGVSAVQGCLPETVVEAAIQQMHSLLMQSAYGPCLAEATSAEWWAHCRSGSVSAAGHHSCTHAACESKVRQPVASA